MYFYFCIKIFNPDKRIWGGGTYVPRLTRSGGIQIINLNGSLISSGNRLIQLKPSFYRVKRKFTSQARGEKNLVKILLTKPLKPSCTGTTGKKN